MGITLTNKKRTHEFDMGYGGFFNLRKNIAYVLDKDFGEEYENLQKAYDQESWEAIAKIINKIITEKSLSKYNNGDGDKILKFLFASDCDGTADYRTAGALYNLIKDVDFGNKIFVYGAESDGKDYEYLKEFFKETYSQRMNFFWQ